MSLKSETRLQTQKNITDAFWELYKKNGISNMTVKEVIKKAGYNRSTFYEYFIDLYDVLDTIEKSLIPTIESIPPMDIGKQVIGMPIEEFLETFKYHQEYYLILLGENGDPKFASKLKSSIKQTFLTHLVFKENYSSKYSDYAIEYVLSGMIGILLYWLSNVDKISEKEVISLIKEIMPSIDTI